MIKIKAGTFGYNDGKKIIPLTAESGAVDLDPKLEARLVKQGIAVYVGKLEPAKFDIEINGKNENKPVYNKEMKLIELKEIANSYGVDVSGLRTKDAVITAIEAVIFDADDDDDYEQPDLGTASPEV